MAVPLHPPRIARELVPLVDPELRNGGVWETVAATGDSNGDGADDLEVLGSTLTSLRLTGAQFVRPRINDCRFDRCELSGAVFEAAQFERVEFIDCRLSGVVLSDARLRHVRFRGCRMDAASIRMVATTSVAFESCLLPTADFYAADLTACVLSDCDLTGADFSRATLTGARLHGSDLTDLSGGSALRDVEIDSSQLVAVALHTFDALGIRVTER